MNAPTMRRSSYLNMHMIYFIPFSGQLSFYLLQAETMTKLSFLIRLFFSDLWFG